MTNVKQLLAFLILITLSTGVIRAQSKLEVTQQLNKIMDELEANNEAMGVLTISKAGKVIYHKEIGFSNVKKGERLTSSTLMKLGSNTKVFTAVMIFQLIDEGKITLDTKLSEFYPAVKNANKITISQMLSHRSGIFDMIEDESFGSYRVEGLSAKEQLKKIADFPSRFEPGSQYQYSNSNYILLTYIIEKISGASYGKNLADRITKKLDLSHTFYAADPGVLDKTASGYYYEDGWNEISSTNMSLPRGAGAIVSTASELNQFFRALMQGKLISQASLEKMTEFRDGRGRGIDDFQIPPSITTEKAVTHGGQIDGFLAQPAYFPKTDIGITFISNGLNCSPQKIIGLLATYVRNPF